MAADLPAQSNYATPYTITTFAGLASGVGSTDGTGLSVRFNHPSNLAMDPAGNVYVADTNNNTVRKITPAGVVTTYAGTAGSSGSTDGAGAAARFSAPTGVAADASGNIFVADTGNNTLRKITSGGLVTTIAGLAGSVGSVDGTGSAARFRSPFALAVDASGNVYAADTYNHTIRKITSAGVVTTLAGTANSSGSADGLGSTARFNFPSGVAVGGTGDIYVADSFNHTIRKITPGGVVTTLAGTAGIAGSANATGSAARFNTPLSVTVDAANTVYVTDTNNHTIRRITSAGVVTTLAGTAGSIGSTDATGSAASFNAPAGITVDGAGNAFVSDTTNDTIRMITSGGVVTTLAGTSVNGSADGTGEAARFNLPFGVALDSTGNVYVPDAGNHTIRKITGAGLVSTLAGLPGAAGSADGTGAAARFNNPSGVAVDGAGNVYVADADNHTIRKVTAAGVVSTLAGSAGFVGSTDGTGAAARFNYPSGVAVDGAGSVYVADAGNRTIRKITAAGVVTTLAGLAGNAGSTDATGSAARFSYPSGVAVNGAGVVYVADASNQTIRKITTAGVVTTLAGSTGNAGSTDGTGVAARFNYPGGIAVDGAGNILVADTRNDALRKITAAGVVTTLAGSAGSGSAADGVGQYAGFSYPSGVAVDGAGNIYVADTFNNLIRAGVIRIPGGVNGDFNGDGRPDILLENTATGQRVLWLMGGPNNAYVMLGLDLGFLDTAWHIVGTADFDGDGQPDILLENVTTGSRRLWIMGGPNSQSVTQVIDLGILDPVWHITGTADFNGDGKPDILLENSSTGQRVLWLMGGPASQNVALSLNLGFLDPVWHMVAMADFNRDGSPDILLENAATGQRVLWLMGGPNNAYVTLGLDLGFLDPIWHIVGTGDFNGDGNPDIILENSGSGERVLWLMYGPNNAYVQLGLSLGLLDPAWHIVK